MASNIFVECLYYDTTTDELVGPQINWDERDDDSTYLVSQIKCGEDCVVGLGQHFEPEVRVARSSVIPFPEANDFTIVWQTPYQVWSTSDTCLIGAVVAPIVSKDIVYQWMTVKDGVREPLGASTQFVNVPPGCYTAKVSFFPKEGRVQEGWLSLINVKKSGELFAEAGIPNLQPEDYVKTTEKIGKGNFGKVLRGHYFGPVAIKSIETTMPVSVFHAEVNAAGKLNHPNIIKLMGVCSQKYEVDIIMELIQGRDLLKIMTSMTETSSYHKKDRIMSRDQSWYISQQICQGVNYLHSKQIVHSDIKPSNVMVTDTFGVKIVDFSIARLKSQAMEEATHRTCAVGKGPGTMAYMAPEVFEQRQEERQPACDVWAIGLIVIELCNYGELIHKTEQDVMRTMFVKTPPQAFSKVPLEMQPIVQRVLSHDPTERPTAKDFGKAIGGQFSEITYYGQKVIW